MLGPSSFPWIILSQDLMCPHLWSLLWCARNHKDLIMGSGGLGLDVWRGQHPAGKHSPYSSEESILWVRPTALLLLPIPTASEGSKGGTFCKDWKWWHHVQNFNSTDFLKGYQFFKFSDALRICRRNRLRSIRIFVNFGTFLLSLRWGCFSTTEPVVLSEKWVWLIIELSLATVIYQAPTVC